MTNTATRLITLIFLLQNHPNQKASDLAKKLGVSQRTVHRYFEMLDEMGIPVYSERGPYGGFSLVRGYKMPPLVFTLEEAVAVVLGTGIVEEKLTSLMKPAGHAQSVPSRPPAVAGLFFPDDPAELRRDVQRLVAAAGHPDPAARPPKALIAPHAGFIYSGPSAGHAYGQLVPHAGLIRRVILLGPVHRVPVRGLALPSVERFDTPLGPVESDRDAVARLRDLPQVVISDRAHAAEHSLEVQLPFLQQVLGRFTLVPLAVGDATTDEVADVLERLWGGGETLIVVSSDLSHYLPYETARAADRHTVDTMLALAPTLGHEQACGATPVNGLLALAPSRSGSIHGPNGNRFTEKRGDWNETSCTTRTPTDSTLPTPKNIPPRISIRSPSNAGRHIYSGGIILGPGRISSSQPAFKKPAQTKARPCSGSKPWRRRDHPESGRIGPPGQGRTKPHDGTDRRRYREKCRQNNDSFPRSSEILP